MHFMYGEAKCNGHEARKLHEHQFPNLRIKSRIGKSQKKNLKCITFPYYSSFVNSSGVSSLQPRSYFSDNRDNFW